MSNNEGDANIEISNRLKKIVQFFASSKKCELLSSEFTFNLQHIVHDFLSPQRCIRIDDWSNIGQCEKLGVYCVKKLLYELVAINSETLRLISKYHIVPLVELFTAVPKLAIFWESASTLANLKSWIAVLDKFTKNEFFLKCESFASLRNLVSFLSQSLLNGFNSPFAIKWILIVVASFLGEKFGSDVKRDGRSYLSVSYESISQLTLMVKESPNCNYTRICRILDGRLENVKVIDLLDGLFGDTTVASLEPEFEAFIIALRCENAVLHFLNDLNEVQGLDSAVSCMLNLVEEYLGISDTLSDCYPFLVFIISVLNSLVKVMGKDMILRPYNTTTVNPTDNMKSSHNFNYDSSIFCKIECLIEKSCCFSSKKEETFKKFTKILLNTSVAHLKNIAKKEVEDCGFDVKCQMAQLCVNSFRKLHCESEVTGIIETSDPMEYLHYLIHVMGKLEMKNVTLAEQIRAIIFELVANGKLINDRAPSEKQEPMNDSSKCWLSLQKLNDFGITLRCDQLKSLFEKGREKTGQNLKDFCANALKAVIDGNFCSDFSEEFRDANLQSVLLDMKFVIDIKLMAKSEMVPLCVKLFVGTSRKPVPERMRKVFNCCHTFVEGESVDRWNLKLMEGVVFFVEALHSSEECKLSIDSVVNHSFIINLLDVSSHLFEEFTKEQNFSSSNGFIATLDVYMLWTMVACIFDFLGFHLHSLKLWTLIACKMFKREIASSWNGVNDHHQFAELLQFVKFSGFMTALRCGSLDIASKFCCEMASTEEKQNDENFDTFYETFIQLKWDCIAKRRPVEDILLDVIAFIDLDAPQVWAFFKSSLCIDFLVVLLAEYDINDVIHDATDASNENKSASTDVIFFTKWKAEAFRFWKSFIRRCIVTAPDQKHLLPRFVDANNKNFISALMLPSFILDSYAELTFMLKSTGLVDLATNYDTFLSDGGYFEPHEKLPEVYSNLISRAVIELAFCYSYAGQFDKSYEKLAEVVHKMLGREFDPKSLLVNAASEITTNEAGDVKCFKAQECLSENLAEIPVSDLLKEFTNNHEAECMCVLCSNIVKNENVILIHHLYETIPRKSKKSRNRAKFLMEKLNGKILSQCGLISTYLSKHFGQQGSNQDVAVKQKRLKLKECRDGFLPAYNCMGSVPSLDNFRMFSFGCTKQAAEAIFVNACHLGSDRKSISEATSNDGSNESKTNNETGHEIYEDSSQLIEALESLALKSKRQRKPPSGKQAVAKAKNGCKMKAEKTEGGEPKAKLAQSSEDGKENTKPRSQRRATVKTSRTCLMKDTTDETVPLSQTDCETKNVSKGTNCVERKAGCITPRDISSRLMKCDLEISQDLNSWAYDLIGLIHQIKDFKLVRGLARSEFCRLVKNIKNADKVMTQIITSSINPTALNVFLHHLTGTSSQDLKMLKCTVENIMTCKDSKSRKDVDSWCRRRCSSEKVPKDWLIVSISDSFDSKVRITLLGQNIDQVLELDSFDEVLSSFVDAQTKGVEIPKTVSKKHYWRQRYSSETKMKDLMSVLNDKLLPVKNQICSFGTIQAVILIVDNNSFTIPWEHLDFLKDYSVGRYPSLDFFYRHLAMHRETVENPVIALNRGFYLLNPGGDLMGTEKTLENFFPQIKKPVFDGMIHSEPSIDTMKSELERDCNLYVYCGHGAGSKYYPSYFVREKVRSLNKCVAMLMGCCSGAVSSLSPFLDPTAVPLDFLLAGSPAVVATLWKVSDNEIDLFTISMIEQICTMGPGYVNGNELAENASKYLDGRKRTLSEVVKACKNVVKLPVCTGCSPIVFGLPVLQFE